MARAKKKQELGGLAEWIVTYGDMVTLLLCFFVALFDTTDADVIQIKPDDIQPE
jgi:chemotaxis protein MotB